MALLDTIHHTTFLVRTTGGTVAVHDATYLAYTSLLAESVEIERVTRLVIEALVDTATLGDGNTLVTTQNITFIAFASLVASSSARYWVKEAETRHWAIAGADFIAAVCTAFRSWRETGRHY